MAIASSAVAAPRQQIVDKARRVIRGYAAAREDWNQASSLSALLRQTQREYEGRFLYELIQNAYDAHPHVAEGEVVVLLDPQEGEHGVLYVANAGAPFTESNFKAICDLAQSDKAPDESIGNKGVGFKSVLQVCDWPEIYSAAEPDSGSFDGYCFTFARPEQYEVLTEGDLELAEQLREDVAPYFLPVPLDEQPPHVRDLAERGLATAIRLPLKNDPARELVVERVARLRDEEVPVHLFLERLRQLEITEIDAGGESTTRTLVRDSRPIDDPAGDGDQRYEYVDLGDQGRWFIAWRRVAVEAMREAIMASIAEGQLDRTWAAWSHDAFVSVAVRTDGSEIRPRFYTFLPMEREASAPLHGHIHAPFSTKLARTAVSEELKLNARLLDSAARAATEAALAFRENDDVVAETALVDLLAWDSAHHVRVTSAFEELGVDPEELALVPIHALPDGRRRGAFDNTYEWPYPDLTLLAADRLARDAKAEIVSSQITDRRLRRLESYCRAFFDVGFTPSAEVRAEWVEGVARELHARRARPRTWDRFYADLAQVFEHSADALAGRQILLGDEGQLHAPPPEDESELRPLVFFPPARERTDEDEEVEGDVELKPPASLRSALVLMSEELTWTSQEGRTRRRTPARRFLEENRLVRRFKTVDLLEHISRVLANDGRVPLSRDALRFSYALSTATRSVKQRDLRTLGLRVPARSGWQPAEEAVFSAGWDTPLAGTLAEFIERGRGVSSEIAGLEGQLLRDPGSWPFAVDDHGSWRTFLTEIGVRDGLWPREIRLPAEVQGSELAPASIARRSGVAAPIAEAWTRTVEATPGATPNHPYTPYRPREPIAVLPGQGDYELLDHRGRSLFADLAVAGLEAWPKGALQVEWYRFRHPSQTDERIWPSPIAAFLRETAWMPVTNPGARREESFVSTGEAWYHAERRGEEPPYFSPLLPGRIRGRLASGETALSRLKALGLGEWGDVADAPRLLAHLARLVEDELLGETGVFAFRRACEDAWSRAAQLDPEDFAASADDLAVVVETEDSLGVRRPADDVDDRLHLVADTGSLTVRVLEASGLPILRVASEDEPLVRPHLEALFGDRLLTVEELELEVMTDSGRFDPDGSGELLLDVGKRWVEALLALVLETKRLRAGQLGPERRREVLERLRHVRRLESERLELRIGGSPVQLAGRHRQVVPVDHEHYPTLIVAAGPTTGGQLDDLTTIARPLCELLAITQYGDPFLLALERLRAQGLVEPADDDFARVLEIDVARVAEVRLHLGSSLDAILRNLAPVVACYEVDQAHALLDARSAVDTEEDLRRLVAEKAPALPSPTDAIATARGVESLAAVREAFRLDYARFNAALRQLGGEYEPIHNPEGHAQAMAHYVRANRSRIMLELRRRYLPAFRAGEPLEGYVDARELPIDADPDWLDAYDMPPDNVLEARVRDWLADHGDGADTDMALPDIDDARANNHALVSRVAATASRVIPAWSRTNRKPLPDVWRSDTPANHVLSAAVGSGVLDFEALDETWALLWMEAQGWWPAEMPSTLAPKELGLSESDLETEADAQERERQERLRRQRILRLDDREFSADPGAYIEIFKHVNQTLRDELLARRRPARLVEVRESRPARGERYRGGGASRRPPEDALSAPQRSALGLVGETIAFAWLGRRYPEVFASSCWVSSYRETIGEPPGDDSLGYDFEIPLKTITRFYEVKATTGIDSRFELGESEVRKAAECARTRRDDYRIIFITNALDAEARALHILQNPLDPRNQRFYAFPGSGLVCRFELA